MGFAGTANAAGSNSTAITSTQAGILAPAISFQGRFDRSNPARPRFAWSGSRIVFSFKGTGVAVQLSANGIRFKASVDGQLTDFVATTSKDYILGTGLSAGIHHVSLWRQTEASQGVAEFLGVNLSPGGILTANPASSGRRIEVIGDSISAAYGNEGEPGCTGYRVNQQNHWMSYGGLAARSKNATLVTTAWSGKGIYRNYDGTTAVTGETLPELYSRTLPGDERSTWSFTSEIPQAVFINVGTNDYRAGDPGNAFDTTYNSFVRSVRGHYPAAKIFIALTPMLGSVDRSSLAGRLRSIVATMNTTYADSNIFYLDLTAQGTARGCDNHPTVAHHQVMAGVVKLALQQKLGW
ncbi:MAG: SGNH/GDSL hydrolase family protein [Nakamurella sp.]